jgi:hypothetical protein
MATLTVSKGELLQVDQSCFPQAVRNLAHSLRGILLQRDAAERVCANVPEMKPTKLGEALRGACLAGTLLCPWAASRVNDG